jgi:cyclopropane fatty-acyl-phospholipid synthase-like methyltransferase
MLSKSNWFFNEQEHSGVDYSDPTQAAEYDNHHEKFRDYQKDAEKIINRLGLGPESTVIDMGAGTGAFTLHAARRCKQIYAVDVAQAMLARCQAKADAAGLTNIQFCHGGFLTYEHTSEPVDAVVSVAVLHHLPDFWKLVGLRRVTDMLKIGGMFYLFDVVFPSDIDGIAVQFDTWIRSIEQSVGSAFAREVEVHIREEHSTCAWIMEGLLERAGLQILSAEYGASFGTTYLCCKPNS